MKGCRRRGVRSTPREFCLWTARWPSSPAHRAALGVRSPSRTRRRGRTWRSRTGRTAAARTRPPTAPAPQASARRRSARTSPSRALAHSVAPRIRVNVLGPGWIETAYGSGLDPAVKQRIAAKIPLGRWGTPEDIAHAAVYLASDAAAYVTGQMLMINGGGVV